MPLTPATLVRKTTPSPLALGQGGSFGALGPLGPLGPQGKVPYLLALSTACHVDSDSGGHLLRQQVGSGPPSRAVCFGGLATQALGRGAGGAQVSARLWQVPAAWSQAGPSPGGRPAAGVAPGDAARRSRLRLARGAPLPLVRSLAGPASPRRHSPPMPCWVVPRRPGASILRVWKTRGD